jgi:uncharacterized protein YndB with AHSA1/START domain
VPWIFWPRTKASSAGSVPLKSSPGASSQAAGSGQSKVLYMPKIIARPRSQGGPPSRPRTMRSDTRSISIDAPADLVFSLVSDPANLPRWAVGFALGVRQEGGQWYVRTGGRELRLRLEADEQSGVVDFWISDGSAAEGLAASRVIPRGAGAEYVFTQFQAPGMPDEAFARSVHALQHELQVLKALAEVDCPL